MTAAISASDLVKTFGRTRALDGVDLEVRTGEVHGFSRRVAGRGGKENDCPSGARCDEQRRG